MSTDAALRMRHDKIIPNTLISGLLVAIFGNIVAEVKGMAVAQPIVTEYFTEWSRWHREGRGD